MSNRTSIPWLLGALMLSFLYVSPLAKADAQKPKPLDPSKLQLASVHALVMDLNNHQVLYSRNPDIIVPIASITKLMTALVVLDDIKNAGLDEWIAVDISQTKEMKKVFSRVRVGSQLQRRDLLLLTLMASENRAAATLAHHYSSGYAAFIKAMNNKAKALGMSHSHFAEPTGLSAKNVSTPRDLAILLQEAAGKPLISQLSTQPQKTVTFRAPKQSLSFVNTNALVRANKWDIDASKTGFTNPAGRCLVLQTTIQKRPVAIVLLDSFGKRTPVGDAARVKRWLETGSSGPIHPSALAYVQQRQKAVMANQKKRT